MHGFTCGVDDLLIMKTKDGRRKKLLENCEKSGEAVHRNFIGIKDENIKLGIAFSFSISFLTLLTLFKLQRKILSWY